MLELKFTLLPSQNVVGPEAVIIGVGGNGFTVVIAGREGKLWHPFELVTRTVYEPDVLIKTLDVAAPFDHRKFDSGLEDKFTLSPKQKVVGPVAVIIGVIGNTLTTLDTGSEGKL